VLASAPVAIAKNYAPPGRAGTSEYAEDIPSAGGNVKTPAMGGGNTTAAQISKLGAGKTGLRKLSKLGKSGSAAAEFALQTAPTTSVSPTPAGAGRRARPGVLTASSGSAISGLEHLLGGSDVDGIGVFLPMLLAFGLGAAIGVSAWRFWRRPEPSA
jgi:hypothetical protein